MTTLHLIRHGRAQALAQDYDQLHEMGEIQARLLGAHLAQRGQHFDAVYVGPLRRQRDTLRLMREAGGAWPAETTLEGLAEGPFELLFKKYLSERLESDPVVKSHAERLRDAPEERDEIIEAIFVHMIGLWTQEHIRGDDLETARDFEARVEAALAQISEREGLGRQVAVVTSNGVIGACVRRALGVSDAREGREGRRTRVHNCSVTCVDVTEQGLVLRVYDNTEHLSDRELLTLL
jgi:broad specificity phosphatase PhoE